MVSFIVALHLGQFLLVYAVLRVWVLDLIFQDIDDSNADHNEHEDSDPLKWL